MPPRVSLPMQVRVRGIAVSAVAIAVVGVIASLLLPLIPAWPFVLLEHFRFQYVWVGMLIVAACGALRMRGWFDAALIATLLNALWVLPDLARSARPLPANGIPLRVLVLNVHTSSSSFAAVRDLITEVRPDLVGLVEVDERWLAGVAPALTDYAQRVEQPRGDNFGIALYSRLPMAVTVEELGSLLPTAVATVDVQGTQLGVLLTHPLPPVRPEPLASQVAQLAAVGDRARSLGIPALIMGDLNATPWSRPFRELVARTGFCDTRAGFGLQASFPAGSEVLRIPIDHMLLSCSIGVRDRTIERDVGSDHLPVVVDLVLPQSEAQ